MTDTAGRNEPVMPPGRELDALVAEKVLGWKRPDPVRPFQPWDTRPEMPGSVLTHRLPCFGRDWDAMRLVVERLAALAWDVEMNAVATQQAGRSCLCVLRTYTPELVVIAEAADTLPRAVALAALKVVEATNA